MAAATPDSAPEVTFERLGDGFHRLRARTHLPLPPEAVFPFFAAAENLQRITPPELGFAILTPTPVDVAEGTLIDYRLRLFGLPFRWRTRITGWHPPERFTDEQLAGPYETWEHTHRFERAGAGTLMTDEVRFRLPLRPLGSAALPLVKLQLGRIFRYRGRRIGRLLLEGRGSPQDGTPP